MVSKICQKRLMKEIKMYSEDNFRFPNLFLRPVDGDILTWYFIVYDLKDTVYENGYYFGKIKLSPQYPLKPPNFYFVTPNGRFETNKAICTTFSAFHQDTYTSTWNVLSMMEGMISFMTDSSDEAHGIGSIKGSDEERKALAKESLRWNERNEEFKKIFHDYKEILK